MNNFVYLFAATLVYTLYRYYRFGDSFFGILTVPLLGMGVYFRPLTLGMVFITFAATKGFAEFLFTRTKLFGKELVVALVSFSLAVHFLQLLLAYNTLFLTFHLSLIFEAVGVGMVVYYYRTEGKTAVSLLEPLGFLLVYAAVSISTGVDTLSATVLPVNPLRLLTGLLAAMGLVEVSWYRWSINWDFRGGYYFVPVLLLVLAVNHGMILPTVLLVSVNSLVLRALNHYTLAYNVELMAYAVLFGLLAYMAAEAAGVVGFTVNGFVVVVASGFLGHSVFRAPEREANTQYILIISYLLVMVSAFKPVFIPLLGVLLLLFYFWQEVYGGGSR